MIKTILSLFRKYVDSILKSQRKLSIFNTGFVCYSISLQLDIMQNSWKNILGTPKYF